MWVFWIIHGTRLLYWLRLFKDCAARNKSAFFSISIYCKNETKCSSAKTTSEKYSYCSVSISPLPKTFHQQSLFLVLSNYSPWLLETNQSRGTYQGKKKLSIVNCSNFQFLERLIQNMFSSSGLQRNLPWLLWTSQCSTVTAGGKFKNTSLEVEIFAASQLKFPTRGELHDNHEVIQGVTRASRSIRKPFGSEEENLVERSCCKNMQIEMEETVISCTYWATSDTN